MSKKDPTRSRTWIYSQVFSAVVAASVCAPMFEGAVRTVLFGWIGGLDRIAAGVEAVGPGSVWSNIRMLLFWSALLWWFRPIARFLHTDDPALRDAARRRHDRSGVFLAGLWAAAFAWVIAHGCASWKSAHPDAGAAELLSGFVVPTGVACYYAIYFTMLYLEPLFFTRIAPRFYIGDELYRRKHDLSLGLRPRLFLYILNLMVIPMALVSMMVAKPIARGGFKYVSVYLTLVTLAYAVGYGEMLYRGIAEPIAELVRKMERLAGGDFDVKTRVYTGDEIGVMKAHFNDMVDGLAERERLKDTFGRYVSVEVAKQLMKAGKIELGGESIEATVLFSDIRDFTPMSERMTPQELVAFLNDYFAHVAEPVSAHNGVVSKFIGDAVMAIFAPQFGSTDHAGDAVRAALSMKAKLAEFNAKRRDAEPVRFGVGLHSGVLVAGNIGTEKRLEYTVIGDVVNVASRIESENKAQDSTILISDETHRRLDAAFQDGLEAERREDIRVKGKAAPLTLYKLG